MKSLRKLGTSAMGIVVGVSSIIVIPLAAASPAAADPAGPTACTPESGYTDCARFTYSGNDQTFTVPSGVTSLRVKLWGAGGGGSEPAPWNENGTGGGGGFTTGTVAVTSGQALTLMVGQGGLTSTALAVYGGGGAAGQGPGPFSTGGSGGGMSALWLDAAHTVPLLIAGGGGGAGGSSDLPEPFPPDGAGGGGGGGLNGGSAASMNGNGGSGASQDAGGDGGMTAQPGPGCELPGNAGTQYSGGAGAGAFDPESGAGGGGGGGYYGGGGGGCSDNYLIQISPQGGAGGGGSGYIASGITDADTSGGVSGGFIWSTAASGGQTDSLYDAGIGVGSSGFQVAGNGEIVLEWVAGPQPGALTSTGTGTASQNATATIPDGGSVTLLDGTTPTDTVTVDGQGTYTLNENTGVITFAPVLGFTGAATPVTYRVADSENRTGDATYTPTVNAPDGPAPAPVVTSGKQGTVLHGQVPVPTGGSVMLLNGSTPATSVVVPGQGTYSVNPQTGMLTFTPAGSFAGTAHSVMYRVTDAYGNHADATFIATVIATGVATASAPNLVVLANPATTVPVTCKVSSGNVARCDVTLNYRLNGKVTVLGTGSVLVHGAGTPRQVVVPVTLNALGHFLAGTLGGIPAAVGVSLTQVGNPAVLHAGTTTKFVNATVSAPQAVYFDSGSATLRPGDAAYLSSLRSKLSGVRSITCVGNTDNTAGWFTNWLLGTSRAAAACNYLTQGTAIRPTLVSNGLANPLYSNATAFGQQLNRRTDIQLNY